MGVDLSAFQGALNRLATVELNQKKLQSDVAQLQASQQNVLQRLNAVEQQSRQIPALTNTVNSLQRDSTKIKGDINNLSNTVSNLSKTQLNLQKQVNTNTSSINTLRGNIPTAQEKSFLGTWSRDPATQVKGIVNKPFVQRFIDQAHLRGQGVLLNEAMTMTILQQKGNLGGWVDDKITRVTTPLSTRITNLGTNLDKVSELTGTIKGRVNCVIDNLSDASTKADNITKRVERIRGRFENLSNRIAEIPNTLKAKGDKLTAIASAGTRLKAAGEGVRDKLQPEIKNLRDDFGGGRSGSNVGLERDFMGLRDAFKGCSKIP